MAISHLENDNFEKKVLIDGETVLVDFWATWCGPCQMLAPVLEQAETELQGIADVAKVDVDKNPQLAAQYGVMSIPTLVLFKDGKEVKRHSGFMQKQDIINFVGK